MHSSVALLHTRPLLQSASNWHFTPVAQAGLPSAITQNAPSAAPRSPLHAGYGPNEPAHVQSFASGLEKQSSPAAGLPPHIAAFAMPFLHQPSNAAWPPAGSGVPHVLPAAAKLCAKATQSIGSSCASGASTIDWS